MYFYYIKQQKGSVPCQGNLGLKISRFSCMIQSIENAYNSVTNGPTFTKFGSYIANFVYTVADIYIPLLSLFRFYFILQKISKTVENNHQAAGFKKAENVHNKQADIL